MTLTPIASLQTHFAPVEDPRVDRTKLHDLLDIVVIAICAVICGADTWVDVEDFGNAKLPWLQQFMPLPNGIPAHDTFGNVFARLDPQQFQACFLSWVQAVMTVTNGQVVAIDGKTLRRSHDKRLGKAAIHMVSAWATTNRLVLGQVKVNDKSNEITAIPALLKLLDLTGCIVTIDAMGTQKQIAKTIVARQADYVLAVKENQGHLFEDLQAIFAEAEHCQFKQVPHQTCRTVAKEHGRLETRQCWTISRADYLNSLRDRDAWEKLNTLGMVRSERRVGETVTVETRYYISSLAGTAEQFLGAVRGHWGVENGLHWTLDVAFREDESRLRKGDGAQNFAVLRHIALNLLKQEKIAKVGIKAKRLKAGWDEAYLLKVLFG